MNLAALVEVMKKVLFLDSGDRLVEADGTISREMIPDLLHVASRGLDIWAEALIPVLEKMYGSP